MSSSAKLAKASANVGPQPAPAQPSVAQLLLEYLKLEGVDTLFGVPGAAVMHVLNELKNQQKTFRYIVTRHETGAAYIADGYHRVSGKLGVVLVTSGPGATNALTGTANAQTGRSSLLVITGEIQEQYLGRGWEQEGIDAGLKIDEIFASATGYSAIVTASTNFQTLVTQALRIARGIPGQAAHLSLPDDVAATALTQVTMPTSTANYRTVPQCYDSAGAQQAMNALLAAKRPLIFLGNGCRNALRTNLDSFRKFVEKFGIPVATTLDGKAIFPEAHELSLRAYGVAGCTWPALYMSPPAGSPYSAPYDYLLVIGSSLNEFATNKWAPVLIPSGPFIQVDLDQTVIGRAMPVQAGIISEAGLFLTNFIELAQKRKPDAKNRESRLRYLKWLKENNSPYADPAARSSNATPIRPERVMAEISNLLPSGGHIFVDAGNSCGWSAHYLEINPPSQVHTSLEMGTMGYSIGAVIGGKMADPDSTCVSICGDGGFMMYGAEVSTAAQYGVGAIWVVLNDNDLHMVSQGMNYFFPDPKAWKDYYKIGKPDLVKFAEALGADAYAVSSPAEMQRAFKAALKGSQKNKPQVLVVTHDMSAMPPFYPPKPQQGN